MDRIVDFNIETLPEPGKTWHHYRGLVKPGIRKGQVLEQYTIERAQKLHADTSKNAWLCQLFCITVMPEGDAEPTVYIANEEREVLLWFDQWIADQWATLPEGGKLIWHTFNGMRFDHPVTALRAIRSGARNVLEEMATRGKYGDSKHVDWFWKLAVPYESGPVRGKLDELANFFGINHPNPITGADMAESWNRGNLDLIKLHTKSRVLILRDLRARLNWMELPESEERPTGERD